ncbi:MAG: DUF5130 family protein [Actinomycetes bacterium]
MAPVPAGELFSPRQQADVMAAVRDAEAASGLVISVYVGAVTGDLRDEATRLHAALGADADRAVLIAIDPVARGLEIITGRAAHAVVDDRACGLVAASMTSTFAGGDLVTGITTGVRLLGDRSTRPSTLHVDQP